MLKLDRYLIREFAQNTFAVLVVVLIVLLGGAFADVLQDVARGKVPAGMLLAQLGLDADGIEQAVLQRFPELKDPECERVSQHAAR